jgi:hypothetical protein
MTCKKVALPRDKFSDRFEILFITGAGRGDGARREGAAGAVHRGREQPQRSQVRAGGRAMVGGCRVMVGCCRAMVGGCRAMVEVAG